MANYLIKKDKKTNQIIYMEYELHGYKFNPKNRQNENKAYIDVKEVTVYNPIMIDAILTAKFNRTFKKIIAMAKMIIELKKDAGITATTLDIAKNPLKLKFKELDAASIPRTLNDVDAAVINGNYAIPAGLSATKDGLFVEGKDSPYVNIIVVKDGNQNDPRVKALVKALQSDKIKNYISEKFKDGEVVAAF